jgi:hypothetical protein
MEMRVRVPCLPLSATSWREARRTAAPLTWAHPDLNEATSLAKCFLAGLRVLAGLLGVRTRRSMYARGGVEVDALIGGQSLGDRGGAGRLHGVGVDAGPANVGLGWMNCYHGLGRTSGCGSRRLRTPAERKNQKCR